jgi:peptidoglycan/xylan/chitin deacetylase (PgdA/CDA1 family)/glycosyltransferase involved in cell wall biosynthesis
MNIMHILSQIQPTGAEAYALTLSDWQVSQGHSVTLISNKIHLTNSHKFISREIHTNSSFVRWCNVLFLRKYICDNKVQIVHAHSRAAVRVAYWATRGLKVSLISTIHGRQHASFSKRLHDIYGERIIPVCENLEQSLVREFKMNPRKLKTIGNPIDTKSIPYIETLNGKNKIALIGRMTGPKGDKARDFLLKIAPTLLASHPDLQIDVIGGGPEMLGPTFEEAFNRLTGAHRSQVQFKNFVKNLDQELGNYSVIIGAGRVAIEALLAGIPVLALGEHSYQGLVTPQSYNQAKASNFGDMGAIELSLAIDFNRFENDLRSAIDSCPLSKEDRQDLRHLAVNDFAIENVCPQVMNLYKSAYFERNVPKNIPVLMYHKVPSHEIHTQHRIFVTKDRFERHLQFFKKKNFQTISFSELEEYRSGKRDFIAFPKKPLIITFDDGYIDNLTNAAPLLKQYGFGATIFLLADQAVDHNYWDANNGDPKSAIMTLEQKKELISYNFEIGSHGFRHEKIVDMDDKKAWHELHGSKAVLEKAFAQNVNVYAFTYGITSPHHAKMAERAGYNFAVNTDTGGLSFEENPYAIFRVNVFPEDGEAQLKKKTSSWYRKYYYWKRGH